MTISEIDREIDRLQKLRTQRKKEQTSDIKEYIGKFYRNGNDNSIGKIYKVIYDETGMGKDALAVRSIWFDTEELFISTNENETVLPDSIELISGQEFADKLVEWTGRILKSYGIIQENRQE